MQTPNGRKNAKIVKLNSLAALRARMKATHYFKQWNWTSMKRSNEMWGIYF